MGRESECFCQVIEPLLSSVLFQELQVGLEPRLPSSQAFLCNLDLLSHKKSPNEESPKFKIRA